MEKESDKFELKDFKDTLLQKTRTKNMQEFTTLLENKINEGGITEICEIIENITHDEIDYLQRMYQFFLADREEKKQDFTPPSIARLCSEIIQQEPNEILDLCGGIGRLTITHNQQKKGKHYTIKEIDGHVIPYLILNLCYNNIPSTIYHENVLNNKEPQEIYHIQTGEKYGNITTATDILHENKPGIVLSNPPFNLSNKEKLYINKKKYTGLMNYAFLERCIEESNDNAEIVIILPNGVLTSTTEMKHRKSLIDRNLLRAVITCPTNMFESTSIPICILYLAKGKKDDKITFINARETFELETRYQKGEGHASHRQRVYKKELRVFSEKQIQEIVMAIHDEKDIDGFSKTIQKTELNDEYNISPNRFVGWETTKEEHRPYKDIIGDINRLRREKNKLKLTCNKLWLKELGLNDIIKHQKEGNELTDSTNQFLEGINQPPLEKEDWIASSNSKLFRWENKDKEHISTVLLNVIPMWKQHIHFLNDTENLFLQELRDTLLPELMTGKIDVSMIDLDLSETVGRDTEVGEKSSVTKSTPNTNNHKQGGLDEYF